MLKFQNEKETMLKESIQKYFQATCLLATFYRL